MEDKGFVYILKDSHFKRGVKIGRAHDVDKRMRPMLTANPWLSVYIKVETSKWKELEKAVHNVIKLVAKTKQVKNSEFYLIEPEKAKKIMLELAPLFDKDDFAIYLGDGTAVCSPRKEREVRAKARHSGKSKSVGLSALGIMPNDKLVFIPTGLVVAVVDDKTIEYKGKRYSLPHSEILIHQPLGGTEGQASDIAIQAAHMASIKERMNRILAQNTGQPYEKIVMDTDRDNWMTPEQALEYGLIDRIYTTRKEITDGR